MREMMAWNKVCCAVDFSEQSAAALRVAVDLCRRLGAALTLLHVDEPGRVVPAEQAQAWRDDATRSGVPADVAETTGDPRTAIAEWTERNGCDAIVMGTRGWNGRARAPVGSVAESTLRRARCPVMIVHAEWAPVR